MPTDTKETLCRCPVRPLYNPGSFGSGSSHEMALMDRWTAEHGGHPYAKARDELAHAMQAAEKDVRSGDALWDMCHDIMSLPRPSGGA